MSSPTELGRSLQPQRIGLVGHRDLHGAEERIRQEAHALFVQWKLTSPALEAYSALAIGADTLLAEVALDCGVALVAVVPFAGFETEFASDALEHYFALRTQAHRVSTLPPTSRSRAAFREAGEWIVRETDVLLAVWDGQPVRSEGGTAETVAYAQQLHKPVIVLGIPPRPTPPS